MGSLTRAPGPDDPRFFSLLRADDRDGGPSRCRFFVEWSWAHGMAFLFPQEPTRYTEMDHIGRVLEQ